MYTLQDISRALNVDYKGIESELRRKDLKQMNDSVTSKCIEAICSSINPNWIVKTNTEVQQFTNMHNSLRQRPDTAIFNSSQDIGFGGETRSSPMLWTERKATLFAADTPPAAMERPHIDYTNNHICFS